MQTITTYGNIPVLLCSNSSKAWTSLLPLVEWELQKHGKWLMVSKSFSWTSDQLNVPLRLLLFFQGTQK
jgi:hypothetical protein